MGAWCLLHALCSGINRTPVHSGTCTAAGAEVTGKSSTQVAFYVKREDLASKDYGGNKVRTLQHQLAVCEARMEHDGKKQLLVRRSLP